MPGRVLVVDDEKNIRATIEMIHRNAGWEAKSAGGVDEALTLLQGERFDVVYLDLAMPGRDGIDGLRNIKIVIPTRSSSSSPVRARSNGPSKRSSSARSTFSRRTAAKKRSFSPRGTPSNAGRSPRRTRSSVRGSPAGEISSEERRRRRDSRADRPRRAHEREGAHHGRVGDGEGAHRAGDP